MLPCGIGAEGLNSGRIVPPEGLAVKSSSAGDFSRETQALAKGEMPFPREPLGAYAPRPA